MRLAKHAYNVNVVSLRKLALSDIVLKAFWMSLSMSIPCTCLHSRRETCFHLVTHFEARSTNVKHCCRGYVEREEGKCVGKITPVGSGT